MIDLGFTPFVEVEHLWQGVHTEYDEYRKKNNNKVANKTWGIKLDSNYTLT